MIAVYIILASFVGIALVLAAVALINSANQDRRVNVSTSVFGKAPTVTVEGYKAEEVPILVLDTTAFYLAAPEKAKHLPIEGVRFVPRDINVSHPPKDGLQIKSPNEQPHRVPGQPRPHVVKDTDD